MISPYNRRKLIDLMRGIIYERTVIWLINYNQINIYLMQLFQLNTIERVSQKKSFPQKAKLVTGSRFYISVFLLFIAYTKTSAQTAKVDTSSVIWQKGYLDIHHINTGRGVCSFMILPDGTTMMVDAGDMDDSLAMKNLPLTVTAPYPDPSKTAGQWITDYIKQCLPATNYPVIDYALLTHFHGDHYGVVTSNTKMASNGAYQLSGFTEIGDLMPIKMWVDRNYPAYDYPVDLRKAYAAIPSNFLNLQRFIEYQKATSGMQATSLQVGSDNQIVLKYQPYKYPTCKVVGVKANGSISTGKRNESFTYFTPGSILDAKNKFNENLLSLALTVSYGKFDYFTGGDNTGLQGYGLPAWYDVETPMAKAVGKVEATTLNHHGNRDASNEFFLQTLQPNVVVEQTWCSDHPGQEVMHRLISDHLYAGEKNIFATNIQEVTKQTLGFWLTKGYKSMFGHVIIRVLPGGDTYYVLIAETIHQEIKVTKVFGPYLSG